MFQGAVTQILVSLHSGEMVQALVPNQGGQVGLPAGTEVTAYLPPEALRALPVEQTNTETEAEAAVGS